MSRCLKKTIWLQSKPKPPKICNYKAKGDLGKLQYEALVGFADLLIVKRDALAAFNRYIPGEYKQHNPFAQQGREFAIEVLSKGFAEGNMPGNLTIFGGQGYGMMHYKVQVPLTNKDFAIADYFKFRGDCIVEHWDVLQEMTGDEPNSIAYF